MASNICNTHLTIFISLENQLNTHKFKVQNDTKNNRNTQQWKRAQKVCQEEIHIQLDSAKNTLNARFPTHNFPTSNMSKNPSIREKRRLEGGNMKKRHTFIDFCSSRVLPHSQFLRYNTTSTAACLHHTHIFSLCYTSMGAQNFLRVFIVMDRRYAFSLNFPSLDSSKNDTNEGIFENICSRFLCCCVMNEEFLSHKFSLRIKILWLHSTKNKKKLEMEGGEKLRNYFYNRKLFLFSAIK